MTDNDDKFTDNIRQMLDQSLEELDFATRSRLSSARNTALKRKIPSRFSWYYWAAVPAAGLATLLLLFSWPNPITQRPEAPALTEFGILTTAEPLDFYQEEIEFYEWLSDIMDQEKELSERQHPAGSIDPVAIDHFPHDRPRSRRTS